MPPKRSAPNENASSWSSLTVPDLKKELELRGLSKQGRKADLIARLEVNDNPNSSGGSSNTALTSTPTLAPKTSTEPEPEVKPKKKRVKKLKEPSLEIEVPGPLASEMIVNQKMNPQTGERRLKPFVPGPDDKFKDKLKRIRSERMFMLDRRIVMDGTAKSEIFDIAGSTGNIYQVTIGKRNLCKCGDAIFRQMQCKHIRYVLVLILKAPVWLQYQSAFLQEELETIFTNAPVTRAPVLEDDHDHSGLRKPIDGDCPICVFEMETGEDIVWCKAACGQNFHKECFEKWRASRGGVKVTCVYCRAEWLEDGQSLPKKPAPGSLASLKETAPTILGYKNIRHLPMYQEGYVAEDEKNDEMWDA